MDQNILLNLFKTITMFTILFTIICIFILVAFASFIGRILKREKNKSTVPVIASPVEQPYSQLGKEHQKAARVQMGSLNLSDQKRRRKAIRSNPSLLRSKKLNQYV